MSTGVGQYKGIKWESVKFDEPCKTPDGAVITGYHIMRYRISESDIRRAVLQHGKIAQLDWKAADKNFDEVNDPNHVDFHPESGNFHKSAEDKCQIVLVKEGTKPEGPGTKLAEKSEMIMELKNNQRYFPNIDDYDSEMSLDDAKAEMFKYLGMA